MERRSNFLKIIRSGLIGLAFSAGLNNLSINTGNNYTPITDSPVSCSQDISLGVDGTSVGQTSSKNLKQEVIPEGISVEIRGVGNIKKKIC